jgi:hypothetical protein
MKEMRRRLGRLQERVKVPVQVVLYERWDQMNPKKQNELARV